MFMCSDIWPIHDIACRIIVRPFTLLLALVLPTQHAKCHAGQVSLFSGILIEYIYHCLIVSAFVIYIECRYVYL